MNLDEELHRLFADERLDLAVRPGAERTILAGARRIRRRRFVVSTAAVVAVGMLVGGGIALAGSGGPESLPPARTPDPVVAPTTTTAPPVTTTSPPPVTSRTVPAVPDTKVTSETSVVTAEAFSANTITPRTYGPLRLGMRGPAAHDTGLLGAVQMSDEWCVKYAATYGGSVVVSEKYGVVAIRVTRQVSTAKGIHIGSTVAEVKAAYPNAVEYRDGLYVPTDVGMMGFFVGGVHMHHTPWPDTGVIERIEIGANKSDCALAF
jgi:hypothetical protein